MACTLSILSIVILCQLMLTAQGQECAIQYTEQPSVSLGCQPYDLILGSYINVRFACTVEAEQGSQGTLNLTWFQQTQNGHIAELGCSIVATRSDGLRQRCLLDIRGETPPADYWCQALYRTPSGSSKPLLRSNVITIGTPDQHNGTMCSNTQSIDAMKCAEIPEIVITENRNSTINDNSTEQTTTSLPSPTNSSNPTNNLITSTSTASTTNNLITSTSTASTTPTNNLITSTSTAITTPTNNLTPSVQADSYHSPCNSNLAEPPQLESLPQLTIIIIAVIVPALVLLLITVAITCTCLYRYRRQLARLQRKSKKVHAVVEVPLPEELEASNTTASMPKYIQPNTSSYIQPNGSYEYLPTLPDELRSETSTNNRYQMLQLGTMDYTNIYTSIVSSGESSRAPSPTQTKQQEAEEAVYMNTHSSLRHKPTYRI